VQRRKLTVHSTLSVSDLDNAEIYGSPAGSNCCALRHCRPVDVCYYIFPNKVSIVLLNSVGPTFQHPLLFVLHMCLPSVVLTAINVGLLLKRAVSILSCTASDGSHELERNRPWSNRDSIPAFASRA
jgi:hypothetical protein